MAKIAVELERALARREIHGVPGQATARRLADGHGWTVEDVICTSGPRDHAFEEQHAWVSIAIVVAGTFQYRSTPGHELMTPGSVLLGNPGQCFECGHEHGAGDRCLSFRYSPEYFERLAADAGARPDFRRLRLPALRALSPVVARATSGLAGTVITAWEELSIQLAAATLQVAEHGDSGPAATPPSTLARVTRTVRRIERNPDSSSTLGSLAQEAGLSRYHFLRTFERLTGATPHQYLLRTRLREAAMRLSVESAKILDIALDCGFGDLSNFNRSFRAEFGVSPRVYRRQF